MKKIFLSLFFIALCVLLVQAYGCKKTPPPAPQPLVNSYTSEAHGFSLEYPRNWKIAKEAELNNVIKGAKDYVAFSSLDDQEYTVVNVIPKEMEVLVKNSRKVEKEETVSMDGLNCTKVTGSLAENEEKKLVEIMCVKDVVYLISANSANDGLVQTEKTWKWL